MRLPVVCLLLAIAFSAGAQDVLTLGSGTASPSGSVQVPVFVRDRSGTALGTDAGAGNRIQGIAFRVLFPTELVSSVTFTRAGITAAPAPMYETSFSGSGFASAVVTFHEISNPLQFTLDAVAPGNQIGTLTVTLTAQATAGSVVALTLDPPSAMLSNQAGTVRETVAGGNLTLVNGSVTVSNVTAPSNVVATASGTSQVNVTWSAVGGADLYEIWRSALGSAYGNIANSPVPSFSDNTVAPGLTYLYRIRAVNDGVPSPFSNTDAATTIVFTEEPLGSTTVKALHMSELRNAVNAMRAAASLSPLASDPTVAAGASVLATHITALRTGLSEARSTIGLSALTYTDTPPVPIKAVHVQEIRDGVK